MFSQEQIEVFRSDPAGHYSDFIASKNPCLDGVSAKRVFANKTVMPVESDLASGHNWEMYLGDAYDILDAFQPNSVGLSVFSPPFPSMYVYTNWNTAGDSPVLNSNVIIGRLLSRT